MARAAPDHPGDFVRFAASSVADDAAAAWQAFSREAAFTATRLDALAGQGVGLTLQATAACLRAAAGHDNVVLIAHWKGNALAPGDLLNLPACQDLAETLGLERAGTDDEAGCRRQLAQFIAAGAAAAPASGAHDVAAARTARREWLNQFACLRPGNRIELWDAMLSIDEVATLFPADFCGTLLALSCYSDNLAEAFRRACPHATILCTSDPVAVGLGVAKLSAAFAIMQQKACPLAAALRTVADMIDSTAGRNT